MNKNPRIVAFTGAGISAESGLSTFRGGNGLWEGYDIMEVAHPKGWRKNPDLVLQFYNLRRAQLRSVQPNNAHHLLAQAEGKFSVQIITQNVDDLHERAGSSNVLHLHGELLKVRSTIDPSYIIPWDKDLEIGDLCPKGGQLRPHVVWFGEEVPAITEAKRQMKKADIVIIIGTSLQVYPAAGLLDYASHARSIFYVDPSPSADTSLLDSERLVLVPAKAEEGVAQVLNRI